MIDGKTVTSTTTIAMLFNYDIRIPARFTEKLTKSRAEPRPSRHPQALDHIGPADYLDPNQVGVRDKPLTAEERLERATITRPAEPKGPPPSGGNANRWIDKGEGKGKGHTQEHRERELARYSRWHRDQTR